MARNTMTLPAMPVLSGRNGAGSPAWHALLVGHVPRPRSLSRRTMVFVTSICLMLPALVVWREWVAYDQQVRATETALSNLASALVQHAEDTVDVADAALFGVLERVRERGITPERMARLNRLFAERVLAAPRVQRYAMYDATGQWIAGVPETAGSNIAGTDIFRHAKAGPSEHPFIGAPVRDCDSGVWYISVSRPMYAADGGYLGVAVAMINTSYFSDHYATFDLGPGSSVAFVHADGTVLARMPDNGQWTGRDLSDAMVFQELRKGIAGSYLGISPLDGMHRFGGYRRSNRYPLVVVAAMSVDFALSDWWVGARTQGAVAVLLAAVLAVLGTWLARQIGSSQVAETKVRDSEARYRLLTGNTTDLITCMDLDFRRTYVSPASWTMHGYEPEEMIGTTPADHMDPADVDETYHRMRMLAAGEVERTSATYRARHKLGHVMWVEVNFALVRNEVTGEPAAITGSARDITERRAQADELGLANAELERLARHLAHARDVAERATRVKSGFLASMSHELRTPLHGILGYAQLLRREIGLTPGQLRWVDAMLAAGAHLRQMINGVLDLSEIEAERVELQTTEVDLVDAMTTCLDLVRPRAEAKGLALAVDAAPDAPRHINTDATRLRQILFNLLGNAVKFTPAGKVELRLRRADGQLRLEVADTGPGIPADQVQRLFQDFERIDNAESAGVEGTGLGLAISCRLAGLMGGRLGHADNVGGGSVFFLEVPLPAGEAAEPIVSSAPEPAPEQARALQLLVVDDVAMNRDIASSFLRSAGHTVTCAEGGAEAVAAAAATDFDVVLMDVRMPEVDGFEATRRIRALPGARGRVPVVALTAQAFAEQVEQCRKAGMNTHLAKPFAPDELIGIVERTALQGPAPAEPEAPPVDAAAAAAAGFALLDMEAFERTAAFLAPDAVATYLHTLANRTEALLNALASPEPLGSRSGALAESAHTLSGSAGMFGFERLASVARRFERAVQVGASEAPALAESLLVVLEASLEAMRTCQTIPEHGAPADAVYGFVT